MRKYKTIMELIFIFILPLILIISGINLKENQITTASGYEWNTYIEYYNKILIDTNGYKNIIQNFNLWDEEVEIINTPNINNVSSKNKIKIDPNTQYCIYIGSSTVGGVFNWYDNQDNLISSTQPTGSNTYIITSPTNAEYLWFYIRAAYGSTYKNDICVNKSVSWANGNYVPYGKPLILYTQTDVSGQNNIVYTPFGTIKNLILNNFKIQQTTTTDILFDYTILWFLMFILWHVLYLFFDMLIHLFIDWGHKEKEKING